MNPFVSLSSLQPVSAQATAGITAPQAVSAGAFTAGQQQDSRGIAVPINWVKALLSDWLLSSALSLYVGLFPGRKFCLISIASRSKQENNIF